VSECYKIAQDAAAAAFFLSFSNRKNNGSRSLLLLLWERDQIDLGLSERERERERERELPQVSHLGFALEKRSCTQLGFARLMFDFVCVFG
jgi:hypothetical protein